MSNPASVKKTTREKIFQVVVKTFEELVGHEATKKAKKQIEKKSRKLSSTIVELLKKDVRKQEKLIKKSQPKVKKIKADKGKKAIVAN
jgi:hypothetical protein